MSELLNQAMSDIVTSFMGCLPDSALLVHNNVIVSTNQHAEVLFGYEPGALIGQPLDVLIPVKYRKQHRYLVRSVDRPSQVRRMTDRPVLHAQHSSGRDIPVAVSISAIRLEDSVFQVAVVQDMSIEASALEKAQFLAEHDALTGAWNRLHLSQEIRLRVQRLEPFAILYLDLDGFKPINDQLGHACGDEVLKVITQRLKTHIKENDMVARIGGDEFVVLLDGVTGRSVIRRITSELAMALNQPIQIGSKLVDITVSIGVVTYPDCGNDESELLERADQAMYRAKKKGHNACFDKIAASKPASDTMTKRCLGDRAANSPPPSRLR